MLDARSRAEACSDHRRRRRRLAGASALRQLAGDHSRSAAHSAPGQQEMHAVRFAPRHQIRTAAPRPAGDQAPRRSWTCASKSWKGSEIRTRKARRWRACTRSTAQRTRSGTAAHRGQKIPPLRTACFWVTDPSWSRAAALGRPQNEAACHRSDPIYRLRQPGLIDQGLIEQGLPGSRWTARPWPASSDASASRRTACGDRFLHRQKHLAIAGTPPNTTRAAATTAADINLLDIDASSSAHLPTRMWCGWHRSSSSRQSAGRGRAAPRPRPRVLQGACAGMNRRPRSSRAAAPPQRPSARRIRRRRSGRPPTGQSWVGCRGCYRLTAPLVENFRRLTCSRACATRVRRRRLPPKPPLPRRRASMPADVPAEAERRRQGRGAVLQWTVPARGKGRSGGWHRQGRTAAVDWRIPPPRRTARPAPSRLSHIAMIEARQLPQRQLSWPVSDNYLGR